MMIASHLRNSLHQYQFLCVRTFRFTQNEVLSELQTLFELASPSNDNENCWFTGLPRQFFIQSVD